MMRPAILLYLCVLEACGIPEVQFSGPLPVDTHLNMAGDFHLKSDGRLVLQLRVPCLVTVRRIEHRCDVNHLSSIEVTATTPWGTSIRGVWLDETKVMFAVDWGHDGLGAPRLSPQASDLRKLAGMPWEISGARWEPTNAEAERIVWLSTHSHIQDTAVAATNRADLNSHLAPPTHIASSAEGRLEARLDIAGAALNAGANTTLVIHVMNHGAAPVPGVDAFLRGSIMAVQGRQASFGTLRPGEELSQNIVVNVPVTETEPDALLGLAVKGINGVTAPNVWRRAPIVASDPVLIVGCDVVGKAGPVVDLVKGEKTVLRCTVRNKTSTVMKLELWVSVAGGSAQAWSSQAVAAGGSVTIEEPLRLSLNLDVGAAVPIQVIAMDRQHSISTRAQLMGTVRKRRLCTPDSVSTRDYEERHRDLRSQLANGELTPAEFDSYDAELVSCRAERVNH